MTFQEFIDLAKKSGFTNIQITIETGISTEISYINQKLDDYSDIEKTTYSIKAEKDNKVEKVITEYLDESILNLLLEKIDLTDSNYEEDFLSAKEISSIEHEKKVSVKEEIKILNGLYKLKDNYPLIKSLEFYYRDDYQDTTIINSNGLNIKTSEHTYKFIVEATAEEGNNTASFDRRILVTNKDNINFEKMTKEVLEMATLQVNKEKLASKKYNIVLDNSVVNAILSNFINMLSAQSIRKKTSCLEDKLNKNIFSPKLNIVEEPLNENYPGYTLFDKEGTPTCNKTIVKDGVIKTYLYDSKEARLENIASTGNNYGNISTRNMYIIPSEKLVEDLLKKMENGLYITDQMGSSGSSINEETGNISIQVFGFIVKNGKITTGFIPVVMSTTIFELLANIEEVGNDLTYARKDLGATSLFIKNISIASE